jgi:hypothetical protein
MNFIFSTNPVWWLALPLLLLPIWWHRQKRQRTRAKALATARFLPAAEPQQQRVWLWTERVLLVLRCMMLIALIALLADLVSPSRGDTVLIAKGMEKAWVDQAIQQAHMQQAEQLTFCASASCAPLELSDEKNILSWFSTHETQWSKQARILILANDSQVSMPAQQTQFAHQVELRLQATAKKTEPEEHHITVVSERADLWNALFKSYESAGLGNARYIISTLPDAKTELIIWESVEAPNPAWRAAHWWLSDARSFPGVKMDKKFDDVAYADTALGRLWLTDWKIREENDARALYVLWQKMRAAPAPYFAYSMALPVSEKNQPWSTGGQWTSALGLLLALLFAIERSLSHVSRNR